MRLDTIPKIEQFIVDALLSSTNIPLGVNVVRLAALEDEEGITRMARSIVVRYTGSTVNVEQKVPVVTTRTMSFELIHSAQSYLTESGHDYALKMASGAYLALNNHTPLSVGVLTLMPFHLTKESFEGISDSSHYTYTQTWEMEVKEIHDLQTLDPCVLAGNCASLFPLNTVQIMKPGDVLYNNELYSPVLPPEPLGIMPYDSDYTGVEEDGQGNLVYTEDSEKIFAENWADRYFTHTGTFDNSGEFLICHVRNREDGSIVNEYFAANPENRRVVQVGGNLFKSPAGMPMGVKEDLSQPDSLQAGYHHRSTYGTTLYPKARIWADPGDEFAPVDYIRYGGLYRVQDGTELVVDHETYLYIGGTRLGKAWVKKDQFILLRKLEMEYPWFCDGEIPDGQIPLCD